MRQNTFSNVCKSIWGFEMSLSTKSSRQFQTDLIRKMAVYVTASYYDPYLCLLSGGDLLWPWSLLQQQGRKSEFLLTATENWEYLKIIHSLSQQKYNRTKGHAKNFCYVFFLWGRVLFCSITHFSLEARVYFVSPENSQSTCCWLTALLWGFLSTCVAVWRPWDVIYGRVCCSACKNMEWHAAH